MIVEILFTIVGGPEDRKEFFYREVSWPDEAPIPRIGENILLGTLFPCEITNIYWAIDLPTNDHVSNEPFLTIMARFKDNVGLLHQAVEDGFVLESHPNFSI